MKPLRAWRVPLICGFLPAWIAISPLNQALAQNSAGAAAASDASKSATLAPLPKLTVKVLDPDGNPVSGAHVGIGASFDRQDPAKKPPDADEDGFIYGWHRLTDSRGEAQLEAEGADLRRLLDDQGIFVRHEQRHLAGVAQPDPAKLKSTLDITLGPECRVSGKVICPDLKKDKRPLGPTTVSLGDSDHVTLTCSADGSGDYHFFVPPGLYLLDARGPNIFLVADGIEVPAKEKELVFEPMLAPIGKLAQLEGQPAPALRGAVAWKNGRAPAISSLKGKGVVLFFWRASQKDSLEWMPAIFDLYDKLKSYGLEVIGVVSDMTGDQKPVDSVQTLDEMLAKVRKESWGGHDIPFPVAIIPIKPTLFGPSYPTIQWADSVAAADYGITEYPTAVLIDRGGKVVGALDDSDRSLALLEKTLGIKRAPAPAPERAKGKTPSKPAGAAAPAPAAAAAPAPARPPAKAPATPR